MEALPILEIRGLAVDFESDHGTVNAVRSATMSVPRGGTLALLGESGCGKSVTGLSVLRLIDPPGYIRAGSILFRPSEDASAAPIDLLQLEDEGDELRQLRGSGIAMIFQEPRASLTPVYTIGNQIVEAILAHEQISPAAARERAIAMLGEVGIPAPERRIDEYPYQLSGGMCQRAMIAMALACGPKLLIADEPTTALDVTVQAQVLRLLNDCRKRHNMSILLITHDMGVVAEMADHVAVMYLGRVVEYGTVDQIFDNPRHPYTQGLFASMPRPDSDPQQPLPRVRGSVPSPRRTPAGCAFRGRCDHEMPRCTQPPPEIEVAPGHRAACWLEDETTERSAAS